MYCYKCGNKLPSVAKFCNKCGAKQIIEENNVEDTCVDELIADDNQAVNAGNDEKENFAEKESEKKSTANQSEESTNSTVQTTKESPDNKADETAEKVIQSTNVDEKIETSVAQVKVEQKESNKGKSKKIINIVITLALVIALGIILFLVISNRTPKVNLNNYVTIVVEGCDGNGTAHFEFDDEKFYSDYDKRIKFANKRSGDEYEDAFFEIMEMDDISPAKYLNEYLLAGSVTPKAGLSNGDVVTFSWSVEEELLSSIDAKIIYGTSPNGFVCADSAKK